jgi:hypothetical protein
MKSIYTKLANTFRQTESRRAEDSNIVTLKDLEELLECPVCINVPPPGTLIYECSNGHIICGACAEQITDEKCPTCRVFFWARLRNDIAEKFIDMFDIEVDCVHTARGCTHMDNKAMIKEHEDNCVLRPVQCQSDNCDKILNLDQMLDHAVQKHKSWYKDLETIGCVTCNGHLVKEESFKDTVCLNDANIVNLKDLEDLLECTACLSIPHAGTPIYECSNGHIICSNCDEQITNQTCPTCKVVFWVKKRNLIAEKLIDRFDDEVPCIFSKDENRHTVKKSMIREHEASCGSRQVKCPWPWWYICGKSMNLDQLVDHAKQKHGSQTVVTPGDVFSVSFAVEKKDFQKKCLPSWDVWNRLYVLGGQTFVPHLWKENRTFHIMVYILASKEVAKKCKVTISISGKDFKMSLNTSAVPIKTPISKARKNKHNSLPLTNFQAKSCLSKWEEEDVLQFEIQVLKS